MTPTVAIQRLSSPVDPRAIRQIAELHLEQIGEGFLTKLGPRFLRRLYASILVTPESLAYAAYADEQVVGLICGATDTASVYRAFLRTAALPAVAMALPKLMSFANVRRAWETLRYPSQADYGVLPRAEVLNFCVSGCCQRSGVGKKLFTALLAGFAERGVDEIRIVTGGQQVSAHRFYESVGATLAGRIEVHRGAPSLVFTCATHMPHRTSAA